MILTEITFSGRRYKKVSIGQWVKISETKKGVSETVVAQSGMKKILQSKIEAYRKVYDNLVNDFEDKWKKENGGEVLHLVQYRVKCSRDKSNDENLLKAFEEYKENVKPLSNELLEVNNLHQILEKQKREKLAGKKEIDLKDDYYLNNIKEFGDILSHISSIDRYTTAEKALGKEVTLENYYINTDTLFKVYYLFNVKDGENSGIWTDPVREKWEELKSNPELEHTYSPRSSSEYLVNKNTGDIYRKSDHWGKCASCYWGFEGEGEYGIGVSNIKDFTRNFGSGFLNPEMVDITNNGVSAICEGLCKMLNREDVYFTKEVKYSLNQYFLKCAELLKEITHNKTINEIKLELNERYKLDEKFSVIMSSNHHISISTEIPQEKNVRLTKTNITL